MGDCAGCGNPITSSDVNDGKSAGVGANHFVCANEYKRRDKNNLCGICAKPLGTERLRCKECDAKPDDYQLKDYYNAL